MAKGYASMLTAFIAIVGLWCESVAAAGTQAQYPNECALYSASNSSFTWRVTNNNNDPPVPPPSPGQGCRVRNTDFSLCFWFRLAADATFPVQVMRFQRDGMPDPGNYTVTVSLEVPQDWTPPRKLAIGVDWGMGKTTSSMAEQDQIPNFLKAWHHFCMDYTRLPQYGDDCYEDTNGTYMRMGTSIRSPGFNSGLSHGAARTVRGTNRLSFGKGGATIQFGGDNFRGKIADVRMVSFNIDEITRDTLRDRDMCYREEKTIRLEEESLASGPSTVGKAMGPYEKGSVTEVDLQGLPKCCLKGYGECSANSAAASVAALGRVHAFAGLAALLLMMR